MSQEPDGLNFNYGGQAVIEGVMMRGSQALAVSVRNPHGEIVTHVEPLNQAIYGSKMARLPFARGLTLLWDALGLGIKALMFSAEVAVPEEEKADPQGKAFEGPVQVGTVAISLAFAIGLFFVLPVFLASLIEGWLHLRESQVVSNLIEGGIRLLILVGYIWSIGLLPDIRRLYGYHGAEHKTINAYEAGAALTPESVARFPLEHPRCGTAFLLTVVIVSILLYSFFPPLNLALRIVSRLLLLPVVAGIAYEIIRFSAKHLDNVFIRIIIKPNLALQRLTTREPDQTMLEVAITAFQQMMARESGTVYAEPALVLAETSDATPR
ncbi:MAG: DUF1385 domain-containing protein [Anaerolineales bacterium]|nr:DUF1385 domain-containing protein [Anaerolineales bacterium]MCB8950537.1 DUF1385 domain-containing protein [Ardenticatenales bacterium]